jgi:hypothetical protein
MKITICGSVAFIDNMERVAGELEALGHEVKFPPTTKPGEHDEPIPTLEYYKFKKEAVGNPDHWVWKKHDEPIRAHFEKVAWSDAILVLNYEKNNIPNYIGPNTLMEMGLSFYLKKPIYLLNEIPAVAWYEEIIGMKPVVIHQNYENIVQ